MRDTDDNYATDARSEVYTHPSYRYAKRRRVIYLFNFNIPLYCDVEDSGKVCDGAEWKNFAAVLEDPERFWAFSILFFVRVLFDA